MATQIDLKKTLVNIKNWLVNSKKILWVIGMHAFLTVIILIIIDIIFGGFLIYKYVILAEENMPAINNTDFQFKDSAYQGILTEWQTKDQKLTDFSAKEYKSPF